MILVDRVTEVMDRLVVMFGDGDKRTMAEVEPDKFLAMIADEVLRLRNESVYAHRNLLRFVRDVEGMNALCAEHDAPGGVNRLAWLRDQLDQLRCLRAQDEDRRRECDASLDPLREVKRRTRYGLVLYDAARSP